MSPQNRLAADFGNHSFNNDKIDYGTSVASEVK